jgi:hypothetical protein
MINQKRLYRYSIMCMSLVWGNVGVIESVGFFNTLGRKFNRAFSWSTASHMSTAQCAFDSAEECCIASYSIAHKKYHNNTERVLLDYLNEFLRTHSTYGWYGIREYYGDLHWKISSLESSLSALCKRKRSIENGTYPVELSDPPYTDIVSMIQKIEGALRDLKPFRDWFWQNIEFLTIAQEVNRLHCSYVPVGDVSLATIGNYVYAQAHNDPYPFVAYERMCAELLSELDQLEKRLYRQVVVAPIVHVMIADLKNSLGALRACCCAHQAYSVQMDALQRACDRDSRERQREKDRQEHARQRELDRQHEAYQRELDREHKEQLRQQEAARYRARVF